MPRTAPTVDGSGNYREVTLKWIDANNGKRSDTNKVASDATDAEIETIVAEMALASKANCYQVKVSMVYNSPALPADAVDEPRESVNDNIVILFKDSAGNSRDWFIPAPSDGLFITDTNNVDPAGSANDVATAIDAAIETAFVPISYRFTERRKKNPSTPA